MRTLTTMILGAMLIHGCATTSPDVGQPSGAAGSDHGGPGHDDPEPGSGSTYTGGTGTDAGDDSTSGSGSGDEGGGSFIQERDGGGTDIGCDVWTQDCPSGQKCMPYANDGGNSWNATKCAPVADDPGAPGEPCTVEGNGVSGIDTCKEAAMCWNVDPQTNEGRCVGLCVGDPSWPSCESPEAVCMISCDGVLALCLPTCDPLVQDCAQGEACYPGYADFMCSPDASGDDGNSGDPCSFLNACSPGTFCATADAVPGCTGSTGCCSDYCDLGGSVACPGGLECVPWYAQAHAPPGKEDLGACLGG